MNRTRVVIAATALVFGFACAPKGPPYDLQFIDNMTAHHAAGIALAQMAETTAAHAELRNLATGIIENERREVVQLAALRKQWFPRAASAANTGLPGMESWVNVVNPDQLRGLSGPQFDLAFIALMVPHQEGGVLMAQEAVTKARHPQLRQMATSIAEGEQREIDRMRGWGDAWQAAK
jgi:uncharacterized protein (DUF305 family)